jgi:hypothetical protein
MSGEKQKLYTDLLYVGAAVRRFDLLAKLLTCRCRCRCFGF